MMDNEDKPNSADENGAEVSNIADTKPSDAKRAEQAEKDLLYLRAEFDNYRRRILREQDSAIKFANDRIVGELTTIVDLLDRGLSTGKPLCAKAEGSPVAAELVNFVTGIELTYRELVQILSRFGVELTGTAGEKFDPNRHEAISQRETSPDKADTVLDVLQRGCLMNGRTLKPARVVVGVAKSE